MTTTLAIPDHSLAIAARPLDVVLELHELLEGDVARAVHLRLLADEKEN